MTDEHARIEELISAMQDGAATPDEVAQVRAHLATCERCRRTTAAYEQIDRQVRRYLMATPVPELAAPWRNEPLVAVAPRGRGSLGHWRVTTVGLALIFVMLFAGTAVTFMNRNNNPEVAQTSGGVAFVGTATRDNAAVLAAPASAAPASAAPPAAAGAANSSSSSRAAASAAASSAPRAAASSPLPAAGVPASARPSAAASAAAASAAASGGGAATTPTAVADRAAINPVQTFGLNTATVLAVCRPVCEEGAQSPEVLRAVVAALDRPLPTAPPLPSSTVPYTVVTLRFSLADGRQIAIDYYPQVAALALPEGRGLVAASPEVVAALAALVPTR